jgi:ABC-type dipeptide/oligopeptide/nickel transport system ATPase subunit
METLSVQNIGYAAKQHDKFQFEAINSISRTFTFGRSYLLDGWPWDGGKTLSWIIGGALKQDYGKFFKSGQPYSIQERQKEAWCVSLSQIKVNRFSFAAPTIQQQIQHGLKTTVFPYFLTEADYVQHFHLTPERYQRPMYQLSNEGWRASCAIGLANGRRIFCFPYLRPDFINE